MLISRVLLSIAIALTPCLASAHLVHGHDGSFGMHGAVGADQQPLQPMLQESGSGGQLSQPVKREVEGKCGAQFGSCAEGSCCSSIGKLSWPVL